jgi:hypothetical protein
VLAAPSDLGADGKKRLKSRDEGREDVSSVQTARERGSAARLQGPRNKLAIAFSALCEIFGGLARIPAEVDDVGRRAGAIQSSLFPDALTFARLEAAATWAHATRLLDRIEEGLEPQIEAMAGPAVLASIRIAVKELGMTIGIGSEPVASTSSSDLLRAVSSFQSAVASYVRVLAAEVDEDDAKPVERFFKEVAPIDQLRSRATRQQRAGRRGRDGRGAGGAHTGHAGRRYRRAPRRQLSARAPETRAIVTGRPRLRSPFP